MTREFTKWRDSVVASLAAREDVVGVAGLGSTAATERADEFSDLDLFIIVAPGAHNRYRNELDWLPQSDDVVLHLVEWHGGGKVLFRDGRFIEWGVGTPQEVSTWLAGEGEVLFDRSGEAATALANAQANPFPVNEATEEAALATFLFAINQGMGRLRRGEVVSGGEIIRSEAVAALLRAARAQLSQADASPASRVLDPIDVRRRVESAFPLLADGIATAVAQAPEPAAIALLALATEHFGDRLPMSAVAAITARYDF